MECVMKSYIQRDPIGGLWWLVTTVDGRVHAIKEFKTETAALAAARKRG
jgi:hypothetical protein